MADLLVVAAVLAVAGAAAWAWRRRDGRAVDAEGQMGEDVRDCVGAPRGTALLLLFTAPTCARCERARDVLRDIAEARAEVSFAEASVVDHAELAREHGVLRTPTVLFVGRDGTVRTRVAGVPQREALAAVVDG